MKASVHMKSLSFIAELVYILWKSARLFSVKLHFLSDCKTQVKSAFIFELWFQQAQHK